MIVLSEAQNNTERILRMREREIMFKRLGDNISDKECVVCRHYCVYMFYD